MITEAIKVGSKLDGDSLIIYVLCIGLLGVIFYMLKTFSKEIHENSKNLATISEQLRLLVQAAISGQPTINKRKNEDD